jgi:hypothetical protein
VVSYDRLVDESNVSSGKNKKRVHHATAERYVKETVVAAKFLADSRSDLKGSRLVLSCQGTTLPQYVRCMKDVLEFAEPGDVLGLGGFCIVGQQHRYLDQLLAVTTAAIPLAKKRGLRQLHVFGLGWIPALAKMNVMAHHAGIECSYDTSSYELNGIHGSIFVGFKGGLTNVFSKIQKGKQYHPTALAHANLLLVQNYWNTFNQLLADDSPLLGADVSWLPTLGVASPGDYQPLLEQPRTPRTATPKRQPLKRGKVVYARRA